MTDISSSLLFLVGPKLAAIYHTIQTIVADNILLCVLLSHTPNLPNLKDVRDHRLNFTSLLILIHNPS